MQQICVDPFVAWFALWITCDRAVTFAAIPVQRELIICSVRRVGLRADEHIARLECCFGGGWGVERAAILGVAFGREAREVIPRLGAADGLVVFANNPAMAVDLECIDDVTLARADARGFPLARRTQDSTLALELIPTAQFRLDDDKVFVRNPILRLGSDDPAKVPLGRLELAQSKLSVRQAELCIDVCGVRRQVAAIEFFCARVMFRSELLSRGRKIGLRR